MARLFEDHILIHYKVFAFAKHAFISHEQTAKRSALTEIYICNKKQCKEWKL
jgi:hypothetical protein